MLNSLPPCGEHSGGSSGKCWQTRTDRDAVTVAEATTVTTVPLCVFSCTST